MHVYHNGDGQITNALHNHFLAPAPKVTKAINQILLEQLPIGQQKQKILAYQTDASKKNSALTINLLVIHNSVKEHSNA